MPQYIALVSLLFLTSPPPVAALTLQQDLTIPDASETMSRLLDVSKECELESEELRGLTDSFRISPYGIDCEVFPCDFSQVESTSHAEFKAQCEDIGGKFVEYTYKFNQQWRDNYYFNNTFRMLEEQTFFEVFNVPECIAPSCSPSQYAHFLQATRQIYWGFDKDSIFVFYQDNDLSQCLNHDLDSLMPETISPSDVQCDLYPCDFATVALDYYKNVKDTCMNLNQKFVEYTIVAYEVLDYYQLSNESKTVSNYPKCISRSCDSAEDFASYYQASFPYGVFVITQTTTSSSFQLDQSSILTFFVVMIGLWNIM